jgi:hypothetical protein
MTVRPLIHRAGDPEDSARRQQLTLAVAVCLLVLTAYVSWFDYAALTAIFHPTHDSAGNLRFEVPGYTNTVYPFTYAGVVASFLGVIYFVYSQERQRTSRTFAVLLAGLVANLASVGMIDCYEQVFVSLMFLSPNLHVFGVAGVQLYWGNAGSAAGTLGGLGIVLAVVPWSRRGNWPGCLLCLAVAATAFGIWFLTGFTEPSAGSVFAYAMNAVSRIASQLALVAAVSRTDWTRGIARALRTAIPGFRASVRGAEGPPSTQVRS